MFRVWVENRYGDNLELSNNDCYSISSISGLDPPDGVINLSRYAGEDGSEYNSAYTSERQITVTLAINSPAEANRIRLYTYLKTKYFVRFFFQNESRDVYIDGYVQSMQIGFFDKKQICQIQIICPKPYFNDVEELNRDFSSIESMFEFPMDIASEGEPMSEIGTIVEQVLTNPGDVETGMIIDIHATGTVVNPKLYNAETNEHFYMNITMQSGDTISINTVKGSKSIVLVRNGTETNILYVVDPGFTWMMLKPGESIIGITADSGSEYMTTLVHIDSLYQGV